MTTSQSENLFRQKLLEESQRWTEENLLSSEQRDAILRRYETPPESATPTETVKEFPRFIQAILALGVFLVGLAVLLLISFNWEYLTGTRHSGWDTVYVSMKQDGNLWKAAGISRIKPQEGVFLRGTLRGSRIEYGIESYYVQEGKGKSIENAMRNREDTQSVIVELVVAPNGKASIKEVHVKGK